MSPAFPLKMMKTQKSLTHSDPLSNEDWHDRSARRQAEYEAWIQREADAFTREMERQGRKMGLRAAHRQLSASTQEKPIIDVRQLSNSEFAMRLAEKHQRDRLKGPTRRDPYQQALHSGGYQVICPVG